MNKNIEQKKDQIHSDHLSKDDYWIDKQDILIRMHISCRTLQRWRSKGILPFSRIGRKIYYKESDLRKLLG